MDEQLVRYASQLARGKSKGMIDLSAKEFVLRKELLDQYPLLEASSEDDARTRFVLLQELNRRLANCIEFVDMSDGAVTQSSSSSLLSSSSMGDSSGSAGGSASGAGTDSSTASAGGFHLLEWSIGARLRRVSHVIFPDAKARLVEAALESSYLPRTTHFTLQLDNTKAFQMQDAGVVDPTLNEGVFVQAFEQLDRKQGSLFRQKLDERDRLFEVSYKGEDGLDWGGLFRESLTRITEDVFSTGLNLLVPCPNARATQGLNLDKYVPNPAHTSPRLLRMFHFLGRVLGVSMRFKLSLPAQFPSIVWKNLTSEEINLEDIRAIDESCGKQLIKISQEARRIAETGRHDHKVAAEAALAAATGVSSAPSQSAEMLAAKTQFGSDFPDQRYTVTSITGSTVELVPGGAGQRVRPDDAIRYIKLAEHYKTHELDRQLFALRQGFVEVVPLRVLRLCRWHELEAYVCGDPTIDVEELKKHTTYHGYNEGDRTCSRFWRVFQSMTPEERSKFVRFSWGRSRLPRGKWTKPFKFTKRNGGDDQLPIGHTCFFQVEMPAYSSDSVMKKRILTAINWGMDAFLIA